MIYFYRKLLIFRDYADIIYWDDELECNRIYYATNLGRCSSLVLSSLGPCRDDWSTYIGEYSSISFLFLVVIFSRNIVNYRYPDEQAGEIPMAYVVRRPGCALSAEQVMEFVAKTVNKVYLFYHQIWAGIAQRVSLLHRFNGVAGSSNELGRRCLPATHRSFRIWSLLYIWW